MKIIGMEVFVAAVPYIPILQKYRPTEYKRYAKTIVKVFTDEGVTGIGGGLHLHYFLTPQEVKKRFEAIRGKDPMELNLRQAPPPFDVALYDIVGKALKVPVSWLLGGSVRDKVPVAYWSTDMTPEDTAEEARVAVEKGFKVYKLKAWKPETIIERMRAIKRAVGDELAVRLDSNTLWQTPSLAIKIAKRLENYDVECLEDPIPKENLNSYRLLRSKIDIPLALHVSSPKEALNAVKAEACDYFNAGDDAVNSLQSAAIADAADMPVWLAPLALCLGMQYVFGLHLCSVIKNATLPNDTAYLMEDDLIKEPIVEKDGFVEVPRKPGLGVELDEEALKKYEMSVQEIGDL